MFRIKFPTKRIFRIFPVLRTDGMAHWRLLELIYGTTLVATQIAKNCCRRLPHSHLRPPPRGTPTSIRIYLIFPETRVIGLPFFAGCMSLSSFNFVQWPPKDASFLHQSALWPFKVILGHPRSMILVPIESAYATSY